MATDPACLLALRALLGILSARKIEYVLIGGVAMQMLYGFVVARTTNDVDAVVLVETWKEYRELTDELRQLHWDAADRPYRLKTPEGCLFDLLPYPIREAPDDRIIFPESDEPLPTIGLVEALFTAQEVEWPPLERIRVAAPPHLAALKAVAWYDRQEPRDAYDFTVLCRQFGEVSGILDLIARGEAEGEFDARARLLAQAVSAAVPRSTRHLKTLAAALTDQRQSLPTIMWRAFAPKQDADRFVQELAQIGRGTLAALATS